MRSLLLRWMACILIAPVGLGCAGGQRVIKLRVGGAPERLYRPATPPKAVEISDEEFRRSLASLRQDVTARREPLEAARRMFDVPVRSGTYLYEPRTGRLVPAAPDSPMLWDATAQKLATDYLTWCQRRIGPGDCLNLLGRTTTFDAHARYALAMAIAQGTVLDATKDSLRQMGNPEALLATIVSVAAMYMMLWLLPEPVSKGVAAIITACLIAYLGVDTVWSLARGWMRLVDEADRATGFAELRAAGQRFGMVMGQNSARIFILLATAALGSTAGLVAKLPELPGFAQASQLAELQGGFQLAAVGAVESVAVTESTVMIALAPAAVAMAASSGKDGPDRAPRPGDADYEGALPSGGWKLTPPGMGAHLVDRAVTKGSAALSKFNQPNTPRFYPKGAAENAGEAHRRIHEAGRKVSGIKLRPMGGFRNEQELLDAYRRSYADESLSGIRGDLRTPDGKNVIATDVSPAEAFEKLLKWAETSP